MPWGWVDNSLSITSVGSSSLNFPDVPRQARWMCDAISRIEYTVAGPLAQLTIYRAAWRVLSGTRRHSRAPGPCSILCALPAEFPASQRNFRRTTHERIALHGPARRLPRACENTSLFRGWRRQTERLQPEIARS